MNPRAIRSTSQALIDLSYTLSHFDFFGPSGQHLNLYPASSSSFSTPSPLLDGPLSVCGSPFRLLSPFLDEHLVAPGGSLSVGTSRVHTRLHTLSVPADGGRCLCVHPICWYRQSAQAGYSSVCAPRGSLEPSLPVSRSTSRVCRVLRLTDTRRVTPFLGRPSCAPASDQLVFAAL